MQRLVLFDIDGTLLICGRQVRSFLGAALNEVFQTVGDLDNYAFSGKTDPGIVMDLITAAGFSRSQVEERIPELKRSYLERLETGLDRRGMRLLPGVVHLLERLSEDSRVTLGLLTGNWEGGARTKLSRFDLNRFFPFGAYGEAGIERRELHPEALLRAEELTGHRFGPKETLIVGDAPADVECARTHGFPVLAVATGPTPRRELEVAGADWVVESLEEAAITVPVLSG